MIINAGGACMDCLDYSNYLTKDKGQFVCPRCYHKRYSKKKYVNHNLVETVHKPTLKDLKKYLEKDW